MTRPWLKYFSEAGRRFDPADMPAQTIGGLIAWAAAAHGPRPAVTTVLPNGASATLDFRGLAQYADDFAAYLRQTLGLRAGDVVALMAPNSIGFAVAALGVVRAGCILTNVNPLYTPAELGHQLADSRAKVLVIIDLFADKADAILSGTRVEHLVTISLGDFFPPPKAALIRFMMKHVKRVVPPAKAKSVSLRRALKLGRSAAKGVDIASYTADVQPDDVALYQYTSGTTGRSKGAELRHVSILANAYQAKLMTAGRMRESGETTLIALPLYHITAFVLMFLAGLASGGHGVLAPSPRPPANLKAAFEKFRITWFTGINTLFAALMNEPWFDRKLVENIRFCSSGGAAQQSGVARRWEAQSGVAICQGYGMTECCGVLTLNPPDDNRLGTVGIPVPGVDVRIVDDNGDETPTGMPGEVVFQGITMMKGYLRQPEATAETIRNGWLHSGDIGVMDADGYIRIVDRKKDMILVSGFNVSPNEVEDAISRLDGVVQVGVIGLPDEKTGEAPMACVVVRDGVTLGAEDVIAHCRKELTNYKIPRRVEFVDEVPTTLSGKVLRRQLRERYLGSSPAA